MLSSYTTYLLIIGYALEVISTPTVFRNNISGPTNRRPISRSIRPKLPPNLQTRPLPHASNPHRRHPSLHLHHLPLPSHLAGHPSPRLCAPIPPPVKYVQSHTDADARGYERGWDAEDERSVGAETGTREGGV